VKIWNKIVGALYYVQKSSKVLFEFDDKFRKSNLEIAPILMPNSDDSKKVYSFERLPIETYQELPPVFAD